MSGCSVGAYLPTRWLFLVQVAPCTHRPTAWYPRPFRRACSPSALSALLEGSVAADGRCLAGAAPWAEAAPETKVIANNKAAWAAVLLMLIDVLPLGSRWPVRPLPHLPCATTCSWSSGAKSKAPDRAGALPQWRRGTSALHLSSAKSPTQRPVSVR
jgi:hypothetical protein